MLKRVGATSTHTESCKAHGKESPLSRRKVVTLQRAVTQITSAVAKSLLGISNVTWKVKGNTEMIFKVSVSRSGFIYVLAHVLNYS